MKVKFKFILLIFIFLFSCTTYEEVTVYPALCKGVLIGEKCRGEIIPLNRTVFKVSVEQQDIIYWMPDIDEEPDRLINCVVRDKRNRIGEYLDRSGKLSMVKGKFQESSSVPGMFYIKGWRWWFIHITGKI